MSRIGKSIETKLDKWGSEDDGRGRWRVTA
jgi:hypothetical protein